MPKPTRSTAPRSRRACARCTTTACRRPSPATRRSRKCCRSRARTEEEMLRYRYKAVTPAGQVVEGALEAPSRSAVIDRLRHDGHTPIRADEVGAWQGGRLVEGWRGARALPPAEII